MHRNTPEDLIPVELVDGRTVLLQRGLGVGELLYKGARLHEKESRITPETRSGDAKKVRRAIRLRVALEQAGFWEQPSRSRWREALQTDPPAEGYKTDDFWEAMRLSRVEARLKQHRPKYSALPAKDKAGLLERGVKQAKAARDAQAFFEYGGPGGLSTRPADIGDAQRDMRAAELKDALDFSFPKIGKALGIPREAKHRKKSEEYYEKKRSNKHAADACGRGFELWMQALSEEEYRAHIETVKPDLECWSSLSQDEQLTESALDELGRADHRTLDREERKKVEAELTELFET